MFSRNNTLYISYHVTDWQFYTKTFWKINYNLIPVIFVTYSILDLTLEFLKSYLKKPICISKILSTLSCLMIFSFNFCLWSKFGTYPSMNAKIFQAKAFIFIILFTYKTYISLPIFIKFDRFVGKRGNISYKSSRIISPWSNSNSRPTVDRKLTEILDVYGPTTNCWGRFKKRFPGE